MKVIERFLGLFHRNRRFTPQYESLSRMKKFMFMGTAGFIFTLSISKFIYSDLIFSFEPNQRNRLYIKLNPTLQRGVYRPSMFMILGIFQRLYAKYREQEPYLKMIQEQLDGEVLNWMLLHDKSCQLSQQKQRKLPLIVVIAGSQGIDNTVKSLLLTSFNLGYRVVAFDPTDLHDIEKMGKIVKVLKQKYPESKMLGIGVEYGANLLLKYAAINKNDFKGLVSIGNPFDLVKSEINLQQSWLWKQLYNSMLKGKTEKALKIDKNLELEGTSLFELEKQLYKIKDQELVQWKNKNSCINSIQDLQVPTLLLQSKEDPFTQYCHFKQGKFKEIRDFRIRIVSM